LDIEIHLYIQALYNSHVENTIVFTEITEDM